MAADREDPRTIWQTQHAEEKPMTIEQIHRRANNFRETVRNRNIFEYGAALYVVGASAWNAWTAHTALARLGFVLLMLGAVFVGWQLRRRASARHVPAQLPAQAYLAAYRDELSRQQTALRNVASWYLAPFMPGFAVILAARLLQQHPPHWVSALFIVGAIAILYSGIWLANINAARSMQRDIDDVESMLNGNG
jgi:hypothetical protein